MHVKSEQFGCILNYYILLLDVFLSVLIFLLAVTKLNGKMCVPYELAVFVTCNPLL